MNQPETKGLQCELRDSAGRLIPNSPGAFSGGEPGSYWVNLMAYCTARLRASVFGGGRLSDGGMAVYLACRGWWDVHPNPTNDYYLSGTLTAVMPIDAMGLKLNMPLIDATNPDVWYGTLTLPPVKIPVSKP